MNAPDASVLCVTCDAELHGEFCHVCGERRADLRDLSVRAVWARALDALTDVDSRFYRTYRALLTQPGSLAKEYLHGRTVGWYSPFEIFLLTTIIFYIYHTLLGRATVFTLPLDLQLQDPFFGPLVLEMLGDRFGSVHTMTFSVFRSRFDLILEQYAKILVIIIAPPLALVIGILRLRTKEPLAMHFAFSLHLLSFLLLILIFTPALLWAIAGPLPPKMEFWLLGDVAFVSAIGAALVLHVHAAVRRAYGATHLVAVPLAVLIVVALFALALAYRFALFVIVFYIL